MDRAEDRPPLSVLSGQLKLGLMEEAQKETFFEEILAFAGGLLFYCERRALVLLVATAKVLLSGFTLSSSLKFWLSRKFVRQKGQLSFPFAHATLVGLSLSLLVTTGGLGEFLYQKTTPALPNFGLAVLENKTQLATEESKLLRKEATTYQVQAGEDIYKIAKRFFVPVGALVFANRLSYPYDLTEGQTLTIPPTSGTPYTVTSPTTVTSLARILGVDAQEIIDFTYPPIDPSGQLTAGQVVMVPPLLYSGESLGEVSAPTGSCNLNNGFSLGWPADVVGREILETFPEHVLLVGAGRAGIDIVAAFGDPLYAAHSGVVSHIGSPRSYNDGYGGSVFITIEGTGLQIRYAHMSKIKEDLYVGQKVSEGEVIGYAGSTGFAFGPHLHFELLCNGTKQNAQPYLTPAPLSVR